MSLVLKILKKLFCRLSFLDGGKIEAFHKWNLGKNHAQFDLNKISAVVEELMQCIPNIDPDTRKICENVVQKNLLE